MKAPKKDQEEKRREEKRREAVPQEEYTIKIESTIAPQQIQISGKLLDLSRYMSKFKDDAKDKIIRLPIHILHGYKLEDLKKLLELWDTGLGQGPEKMTATFDDYAKDKDKEALKKLAEQFGITPLKQALGMSLSEKEKVSLGTTGQKTSEKETKVVVETKKEKEVKGLDVDDKGQIKLVVDDKAILLDKDMVNTIGLVREALEGDPKATEIPVNKKMIGSLKNIQDLIELLKNIPSDPEKIEEYVARLYPTLKELVTLANTANYLEVPSIVNPAITQISKKLEISPEDPDLVEQLKRLHPGPTTKISQETITKAIQNNKAVMRIINNALIAKEISRNTSEYRHRGKLYKELRPTTQLVENFDLGHGFILSSQPQRVVIIDKQNGQIAHIFKIDRYIERVTFDSKTNRLTLIAAEQYKLHKIYTYDLTSFFKLKDNSINLNFKQMLLLFELAQKRKKEGRVTLTEDQTKLLPKEIVAELERI